MSYQVTIGGRVVLSTLLVFALFYSPIGGVFARAGSKVHAGSQVIILATDSHANHSSALATLPAIPARRCARLAPALQSASSALRSERTGAFKKYQKPVLIANAVLYAVSARDFVVDLSSLTNYPYDIWHSYRGENWRWRLSSDPRARVHSLAAAINEWREGRHRRLAEPVI